jgi:hypothetical protein
MGAAADERCVQSLDATCERAPSRSSRSERTVRFRSPASARRVRSGSVRTLVIAAMLLTACSNAPSATFVLEGVISADATCVVQPESPLLAEGVVDTTPLSPSVRPVGMRYVAFLRVSNYERMSGRGPWLAIPIHLVANHVRVEIRRDGELVSLAAAGLPNPFLARADGAVGQASADGIPAHGVVSGVALPDAYVTALDAAFGETDLELSMSVVAYDFHGTERTSTTVVFPLRLCLGCLVACAPPGTHPHTSCVIGQDEPSTVACE